MAKSYDIAVMPGDGTGPEVTVEAVKVLKAAEAKFGFKTNLTEFDFGGERYKKTGETLPDSGVEELRKFEELMEQNKLKTAIDYYFSINSLIIIFYAVN